MKHTTVLLFILLSCYALADNLMVRIKNVQDEPQLTLLQLLKSNHIKTFEPVLPPTKTPRIKSAALDRLARYFYPIFTDSYEQALKQKSSTLEALRDEILKLDFVDACYIIADASLPIEKNDQKKTNSNTPNFVNNQFYLNKAPNGVDPGAVSGLAGGKGEGVTVCDIEGGFDLEHEDLIASKPVLIAGVNAANSGWLNHGTACLGEIASTNNGFGTTGIAPKVTLRAASIYDTPTRQGSAAKTFIAVADQLKAGDIMLIELHRVGPNRNFIAMEWWPDNFDALKYATDKGIIVIEAAGNGYQNLELPIYDRPLFGFPKEWENPFRRKKYDSGCILVGAGAPPSGVFGPARSRLDFSNYGANVDVQGYGREVCTTGYGDLFGGRERNRMYTNRFSGTSSASPIVVGAVAALQGYAKARGNTLTPEKARALLRNQSNVSPQQNHPSRPTTQRIGGLPDLAKLRLRV